MNLWRMGRATTKASGQFVLGFAIAALMSGCALNTTTQAKQSEIIGEKLDNTYVVEDGTVRHDVTDADVARLWQEFNALRRQGDLPAAKLKLQEAITITPNDPGLWSTAAELELIEGSHLRAENFAAKSNFLAGTSNQPLRHRNWIIIERSREGRGDLLGARQAQLQSAKLQQ